MSAAAAARGAAPAAPAAAEGGAARVALAVPGLHCAACMGKVERALSEMPGVAGARVNLTLRRVTARTARPASDLAARLAEIGYEAHPLDGAALGAAGDAAGRGLLLRLGVAGFAMMNVMLLSVAVWSGAADATRDLFHLLSAAISLPVVAYSGQPFFRSALGALKGRRLNMDVPISLAIVLAAGMSLYESLMGGRHAYFDAALSLTFFLLAGRYLDHRARASARSAARELSALEVHTAERLADGRAETVPLSRLRVGDEILVPAGARVPVDGILSSERAVTDRSFLTGESDPAESRAGEALRAGEINLGPPASLAATAVGEDTSLRRIARLVGEAETARNRYTGLADRAARIYAPAVHLLALAAFLGWILATGDARLALNVAIAVLIITCPCALGLAVPAVSTAAIGRLCEDGFLVTSGTALERLAEAGRVVFDKTGTLTRPGLALDPAELDPGDAAVALALAQRSTHPVSRAVAAALGRVAPAAVADVREIAGRGLSGTFRGEEVRLGEASWAGAEGPGLALRIGGRAMTLGQREALRPGAAEAVEALRGQGMALALLSGDAEAPVARVASELGIGDARAGVAPEEKHRAVAELGRDGVPCVMVGDGLNDTAALAAAHASVAPSSALDAARSAADVVLLRESLAGLPRLLAVARMSSRLCRQNFAIAALYNLVAVPVALAGLATPLAAALAMSASSITVLLNALRVRLVR